jgi:hypothetical protein
MLGQTKTPPEGGVRRRGEPASVGAGPGLLLEDQVTLDGEDAATLAQVEKLDQLGIYVQLVAVFAQTARDTEAEAFASIGKAERRVEARADEAPSTAGTAFSCA